MSGWDDVSLEETQENDNVKDSIPKASKADLKKGAESVGFTSREQTDKKEPGRPRKREKTSNIPFAPPSARFKKAFKMIALERDKTMQDIFDEALTQWFKDEGLDYTQYFNN